MRTILFFQPPLHPCIPGKIAGVRDIASRRGVQVQMVNRDPTAAIVAELVKFWNAIGAIVECGARSSPLDPAMFGRLPVVYSTPVPGQRGSPMIAVHHDSVETARLAAREMLSAGLTSFAFLPYPEPRPWSRTREREFTAAIRRHGYECRVFRTETAPEIREGEPSSIAWLSELRRFLAALPRPCGVFAVNDVIAESALKAAGAEGIAVPDELAVLGVDNDVNVCGRCVPALSSVDPDYRRAGMLAAELLFEAAEKGGAAAAVRYDIAPLRVAYRESMRSRAVSDRRVAEALDLIRRKACDGLRASSVAALFPCSERLAYVRFRKATGHTILGEIHAVQLSSVKRLLETTDIPLKALADFCGFEDPNSLRKFFRRETGTTLRAWRLAHRAASSR